jgi:hypothetical protein
MQSYLDWNKLPDHHLKGDQTTQNDIPYIVQMIFNINHHVLYNECGTDPEKRKELSIPVFTGK